MRELDVDVGDHVAIRATVLGEGPPVAFLHGSGPGASGPSNFLDNGRAIAAAGYQAILLDSVGYGRSSKPVDRPYTLSFMAGCAARALQALGHARYTLVGNSQGGAQAIRLALDHPDRVEKLVLMAPGGLETRETYMELAGIRSMMRCLYGPEGITEDGMRKLFGKQLFDASRLSDAIVRDRTAAALDQPMHVFKTMVVDDQSERLPEIRCPVLGMWGMNDVFCPPSGAVKLATQVPDCRVVLFNRCGHWVMVEHRERFDRLLRDFLDHG